MMQPYIKKPLCKKTKNSLLIDIPISDIDLLFHLK